MAASTVSLKLLINSQTKKVLFAEVNKDFVDFLFRLLSLPAGTIINLLKKQELVGSLSNLYQSLQNLNDSYIQPNQTKNTLLNPVVAGFVPMLAINDATERKYCRCTCNQFGTYVTDDINAKCPNCKKKMTTIMNYVAPDHAAEHGSELGGFVKGVVTYMVMDDLVVTPLSTISSITLLKKLYVQDVNALDEKVVVFGMDETGMDKCSVSLKLLIDNQAKRVLFAEAGKDCVDFLFYILSLPVAKVIALLGKQKMVGSLANLYESIENLDDSYVLPNQTKNTLLQPVISGPCVPLLGINDATTKNITTMKLYRCGGGYDNYFYDDPSTVCPYCTNKMGQLMQYLAPPAAQKVPCNEVGFVKGVVTYTVMDDLVVKPASSISSITLLRKFDVKDVRALEEKVVDLGMDEAVKLLKASLETKNVLTRVFLNDLDSSTSQQGADQKWDIVGKRRRVRKQPSTSTTDEEPKNNWFETDDANDVSILEDEAQKNWISGRPRRWGKKEQ